MNLICQLFKKLNKKYRIEYISGHKYIITDAGTKIEVNKNTMTIFTHEQCCHLPITPTSITYLENVLKYE